jgi:hypothetical protein
MEIRNGARVDLVHAVGHRAAQAAVSAVGDHTPLVVTPLAVPSSRSFASSRRRRRRSVSHWLVHGRTAARELVRAGIAPSGNVAMLPLLPVLNPDTATMWSKRAAARSRLRLAPGARLIAAAGRSGDGSWQRFRSTIDALARDDVHALWLDRDDHHSRELHMSGKVTVAGLREAADLVAASDVIVGVNTSPSVSSLLVDAATLGIRTVALAEDTAAEVVLEVGGRLATLDELPQAITSMLSPGHLHSMRQPAGLDTDTLATDLVEATVRAYTSALARPLQTTELLSRRANA